MPVARSPRRARLAALVSIVLAITGFQFFLAPPAAQADVSTKIAAFPYSQDWSNAALITVNDDWSGVTGVEGYRGDALAGGTGADPQTVTADGSGTPTNVIANGATSSTSGGVLESVADATIAVQGSGTARVPHVVFHLDLTGKSGAQFSFDAKDIDATTDNSVQPIAVQYRVGTSGAYTNLPAGFIDDASTGPSIATLVTHKDVPLPAATDGQGDVFVRVLTADAVGSDEWIGIDNIAITTGGAPAALSLANPGPQSSNQGMAIGTLQLAAAGGTPPYTYGATNLPPGLSIDTGTGQITGTPNTTVGSPFAVNVSVSDSAAGSDNKNFTWTVSPALVPMAIKDIQGTGASTPIPGQVVLTQGVVTASYPTGGFNGFFIQTPGPDTADASDGIFVYGGASGFATYPAVGDSVDVTGTAGENFGKTELSLASWSPHGSSLGTVTPKTVVPGTDCTLPGGACANAAALDIAREATEGEAFQPTGSWTLTDVYDGGPFYGPGIANSSANHGELGVAAESTKPLVAPTELYDVQTQAIEVTNRGKWNDAHRIIVDDGSSLTYSTTANSGSPFPWMTPSYVPRVGAAITFPAPVILIKDFSAWRLLPSSQVVGAPSATQPQLQQTRAANATPQNVGGDVKLATFNVLNFFPTHGNEYEAANANNHCTYFTDRAGAQITTGACGNPTTGSGNGPRGAANAVNVVRQRDKIVSAINTANADIVSLEELENSAKFGKNRDFAIAQLVAALNAASIPGKWDFAPSPVGGDLPPLADEDVIRTGFIYQPARVSRVGSSKILVGSAAFGNAREPLAQAFKRLGTSDSDGFAVIVNHFKSKGSGADDGTGQGNANPDRVAQANALVTFANQFQVSRGLTRTFLVGDFNAYSHEDPIDVLVAAGYAELHSTSDPDEESYNFDGQIGSLDHVLANGPAAADVTGVDVWPINGYESVYYEYSRFNYNVTNLYSSGPFRSSDHSPEIVGIDTADPTTKDIQILGTNDFHGRLENDTGAPTAGAAVLAGAVKQLRGNNPNTVFAAAGDLIGASTFASFIAHDKPTIDALNEAGLDVSSVGNHEFDQGFDDLANRVIAPYDPVTNPEGGAKWKYLADNVRLKSNNARALTPSWTKTFGNVKVGFIGAVTEHLPELVSPAGISQLTITDIVSESNQVADQLKANGADIVVLLVHEGAPSTNCNTMDDDATSDFGSIINGVNENIDAIVSGHTHLAYNCSFQVDEWAGRSVTDRPVVSSGQYGMALNRLVFTVDSTTGEVQAKTQALLNLKAANAGPANYPADPATQAIVDAAVAKAEVLGAVPLGNLGGPFFRGKLANGTTENRGAESTLGNLVAEVQKWATRGSESGAAQIAFMNPGGLRDDLTGVGSGAFPRTLTYKQAAVVQPFANTLVNMDLTGAQIKTVLEQQWQAAGASRPFLKLGISKGFTYTFDDTLPQGSRITGIWLDGTPIVPATVYSVTVNSFLASGGDGFTELNNGAGKQDTGKTDLAAMVDYMAAFGAGANQVAPDYRQNGVGVAFPDAAPAAYAPGDQVKFDVSSWSMTNALDTKDTEVTVKLGAATLGTALLDNAPQASLPGFDIVGTASVDVLLPANTPSGAQSLTLVGTATGTEISVPLQITGTTPPPPPPPPTKAASTTEGKVKPHRPKAGHKVRLKVTVDGASGVAATGQVQIQVKGGKTKTKTVTLENGMVKLNLGRFRKAGKKVTVTITYLGSDQLLGSSDTVKFRVRRR